MITKPPPQESAPTFSAVQQRAAIPPVVPATVAMAASGESDVGASRPGRRASSSDSSPQASRTRTSHGPSVAAAAAPTRM
jgi:hypothetical protein